jgi:hypothetical protein
MDFRREVAIFKSLKKFRMVRESGLGHALQSQRSEAEDIPRVCEITLIDFWRSERDG